MDHVPNKEVTRVVGWGWGGWWAATLSSRLSARELPCLEAQGPGGTPLRPCPPLGVQVEARGVSGSCTERTLSRSVLSRRWGRGTRMALLREPSSATASSPCPDTQTHTTVLVPTSVPLSFPLKPTLFSPSCGFSVANSGD